MSPFPVAVELGAQVKEIVQKLQVRAVCRWQGCRVKHSAMAGGQLQDVNDVDISSKIFDPTVTVRQHGISCQIRAIKGRASTYSAIRFSWVDPLETKQIEVVKPAGWTDAFSTSSGLTRMERYKG